jgi:DNA-directed RNA polymerase specialized sigma24 family protein
MSAKATFTDYELVRAIHIDNKEVLNYLYEHNFADIERYIINKGGNNKDVSSLLKDSIIELWYNINHHQYEKEKDLNNYLFSLVKDRWAKENKTSIFIDKIAITTDKSFDKEVVAKCVDVLEPQQKTILSYHYFEGYDFKRIASILNLKDEKEAENKFHESEKSLKALLIIRYPSIEQSKDFKNVIINGVVEYRYHELSSFIVSGAVIPEHVRSFNLAWLLVLLIFVLGGIGIWLYANDYSFTDNEKKTSVVIKKKESQKDDIEKGKLDDSQNASQDKKQVLEDTINYEQALSDTAKSLDADFALPPGKIQVINSNGDVIIKEAHDTSGNTDIIVKKDELLYTIYSKVRVMSGDDDTLSADTAKNYTASTAEKTAQLLNPEAKLPTEDKKVTVYQVELWKSPINYKGYKMQKSKIVIFGIDRPELVKFIDYDDDIYLQSGTSFYMLVPSIDFRPFVKVKDKSVIAELIK